MISTAGRPRGAMCWAGAAALLAGLLAAATPVARADPARAAGHRVSGSITGVPYALETVAVLLTPHGHQVAYDDEYGDGAGTFAFNGIPDGTYKLYVRQEDGGDPSATLDDGFYDGRADLTHATPVAVHGRDVDLGQVALPALITVTGRVRTAAGEPAKDVRVNVARRNPRITGYLSGGYSGTDGRFSFQVPPGQYRFQVEDGTADYDAPAVRYAAYWLPHALSERSAPWVTVTHDLSLGALTVAAGGGMTGQVTGTGPLGGPLFRVDVTALAADGTVLGKATTARSGGFRLAHLLPGSYRLRFSDPYDGFRTRLYRRQGSLADATPVAVRPGRVTVGLDDVLAPRSPVGHPGTDIEGTVTDQAGRPAVGVVVFARVASSPPNYINDIDEAETDRAGRYHLQHLDPDSTHSSATSFKLEFADFAPLEDLCGGADTCGRSKPSDDFLLVGRYSGDQPSFESATPVTLRRDGPAVCDIALQEHGGVSGTVAFPASRFARGVGVDAFDVDGRSVDSGFVHPDGRYDLHELVPGTYRLRFTGYDEHSRPVAVRWWRSGQDFASATDVTVEPGVDRRGISVRLPG